MKIALSVFVCACLAACTSRDLYNNIQQDRLRQCERLQETKRAECLERWRDTYDDYERKRQELLKDSES
jgi:hypothetical protein